MTGPVAAIIADDLTGALDSAVPFAMRGWKTIAVTSVAAISQALNAGAEVISVSLDSREIPQAEAAVRMHQAALALSGFPVVLKKIDSRLKGNVAAEVAALLAARLPQKVVVCPAIPELGRRVSGGFIRGMGIAQPIPVAPCLPPFALGELSVPDAETDQDLAAIVQDAPAGTVFVGARGLASALAAHLAKGHAQIVPDLGWSGPVAVVVGSRDPITLEQVDHLRSADPVQWIAAPGGVVPEHSAAGSVIVQATQGSEAETDGRAVSLRLAQGFVRHHSSPTRHLVLTGGETAAAVLAGLGVTALEVLGEAQPGLPVCRDMNHTSGPVFITKSGGFGAVDCLLRLVRQGAGQV
ncbi:four-carbon acid sugar kinase family protein [Pseudotabrizicola sp.]|uniref:four-carbon acid sugar kinase family protein n=1 Tax=Pseudotabrizicola sp. TaxID=2939647 RepID=UPI00272732AE|nr:four-carbon acid sugar kinase family protein [Pseudotabrizicola sp.]MDO8884473.1 four-carbon acid sugar kinase family protein [Pseudotabrizicola sp.]